MSESAAIPSAAAGAVESSNQRAVNRMRRQSLGQLILLVIQTGLGMYVNLFIMLPTADQGQGMLASFKNAMTKGPAGVAAHSGLGALIVLNALVLLVFSFTVRHTSVKICSFLGLLAIIGAAVSGASFVNATVNTSAATHASMAMAVNTLVAIACYGVNLFSLGGRRAVAEVAEVQSAGSED